MMTQEEARDLCNRISVEYPSLRCIVRGPDEGPHVHVWYTGAIKENRLIHASWDLFHSTELPEDFKRHCEQVRNHDS